MSLFGSDTEIEILELLLRGAATPHVQLHTADPTDAGTGTTVGPRKPVAFDAPTSMGATGHECLSSGAVSWDSTDVPVGTAISWVSIWSAETGGVLRWRLPLAETKTTGSDGVLIAAGDLRPGVD